jgi:hypothetical protein
VCTRVCLCVTGRPIETNGHRRCERRRGRAVRRLKALLREVSRRTLTPHAAQAHAGGRMDVIRFSKGV